MPKEKSFFKKLWDRAVYGSMGLTALVAIPFAGTEIIEQDVCLDMARNFDTQILALFPAEQSAVSVVRGKDFNTVAVQDDNKWTIRLAATRFALTNIVHTSLEVVPAGTKGHMQNTPGSGYQLHGIIVDASKGSPSNVSPCDARSLYNQFSGGNLLKGTLSEVDLNEELLGRKPTYYIDITYGNKEEILEKLDVMKDAIRRLNGTPITYGLYEPPNSNSFVRFLLDQIQLSVPEGALDNYNAPGFNHSIKFQDKKPSTQNVGNTKSIPALS